MEQVKALIMAHQVFEIGWHISQRTFLISMNKEQSLWLPCAELIKIIWKVYTKEKEQGADLKASLFHHLVFIINLKGSKIKDHFKYNFVPEF